MAPTKEVYEPWLPVAFGRMLWDCLQKVIQTLKLKLLPSHPTPPKYDCDGQGDHIAINQTVSAKVLLTPTTINFRWTVPRCNCRTYRGIINQQCLYHRFHFWNRYRKEDEESQSRGIAAAPHPAPLPKRLDPDQRLWESTKGKPKEILPIFTPETIADKILLVFQRYGQHTRAVSEAADDNWKGRGIFLPRILSCVREERRIPMILPAFPWKSVNKTTKVLSHLPDLGEALALARLNQLCEDVKLVYAPGAEITIATDGVVFDDVVGIPEEDTWAYGEELERLMLEGNLTNLKLCRPMEMMGLAGAERLSKERYLQLCAETRATLLREHGRTEAEVREMIKSDNDTLMTYCGFIRFLETDLRHSKIAQEARSGSQYRKRVKKVAVDMMIRAESFTKFLQSRCPDSVRLSIHPSSGAVKLSVPLIIQTTGEFPRTPWHCCIAVGVDGSYRTCHSGEVQQTHRLILHHGRPYYYREKSPLWDWETDDVVFEPQYPKGLIVRPRMAGGCGEGSDIPVLLNAGQVDKLLQLAQSFGGTVHALGFANCGPLVFPPSVQGSTIR